MSYSKLHSSIVNSSLWAEADAVRILFVTLLAMCDRDGNVYGSRIGLERQANIHSDPSDPDNPWEVLLSPDPESSDKMRAPENQGRRIEEIPGGFRLLNFEYYRGLRNEDDRREQTRRAVAKHREKKAALSHGKPQKATDSHSEPPLSQSTDTEAEADSTPTPTPPPTPSTSFEVVQAKLEDRRRALGKAHPGPVEISEVTAQVRVAGAGEEEL